MLPLAFSTEHRPHAWNRPRRPRGSAPFPGVAIVATDRPQSTNIKGLTANQVGAQYLGPTSQIDHIVHFVKTRFRDRISALVAF